MKLNLNREPRKLGHPEGSFTGARIKHTYSADEFREIFSFVGEDFEKFIDILFWFETLFDKATGETFDLETK